MKKSTQSQMHNEATVHCFNMSLNTFKFNPFRHIGRKKKQTAPQTPVTQV